MKRLSVVIILILFVGVQNYAQVESRLYLNKDGFKDLPFVPNERPSSNVIDILKPEVIPQQANPSAEDAQDITPFRVGIPVDVNYSLNDGKWEKVSGGRLWSLTLKADDAKSVAIVFSDLFLPERAQLYVVNQEGTMLYGPVTNSSITEGQDFMTNIVDGSNVTIYIYEPYSHEGMSRLEISRVLYGLVGYGGLLSNPKSTLSDCSLDVACVPGWDLEADATGYVITSTGMGGCGALLMTTDNSYKGYFLTAKHVTDTGSISSVGFFCRKKSCGNTAQYTVVSCHNIVKRASYSGTDMSLLEILDLPTSEKLTWLGWDRTGASSPGGAIIHNPGSINPTEIAFEYGTFSNYDSYYWKITLDDGYTAHGSSGAVLLNSNRKVVGQLRGTLNGGSNDCENYDKLLGKFSRSWTGGGSNSTRLSNWLDPTGTNLTSVNTKRRHNPTLSGPETICYGTTGTYTISDLPSNAVIQWTLVNETGPYTPTLQTSGGTCSITNNYSKSYMGTLTASVYWDGYLLKTMSKTIILYSGFYGVYNHGNTTNQQITIGSPIWVTKGQQLTILSPNLVGKNVTYSVTTPSAWQYISSSGKLILTYPNVSTNNPIIISIQDNTNSPTCDGTYQLVVLPNTLLPSYLMDIGVDSGIISVTLSLVSSEDADKDAPSILVDSVKNDTFEWTLEVYNATTGEKVFGQKVEGSLFTVDTTGWKPGVYVVRAIVGDEVLTEKVVVK